MLMGLLLLIMKYYKPLGIFCCLLLICASFMPWAYYADLGKSFTGFFSENNSYGKPGKYLSIFAVISIALIITPKVWAKRVHLFLAALGVGYAVKTYILFTSCYKAYCPEKQAGIFLMLISTFLILIVSIFPDLRIEQEKKQTN